LRSCVVSTLVSYDAMMQFGYFSDRFVNVLTSTGNVLVWIDN